MRTFFRNLYTYRELLFALSKSYTNARYKQTILGFGWALLPALILLCTTLAVFPNLFAYKGSIPYPIYIFLGFWIWTFFSNALSFAVPNLVANTSLLRKVYFPREVLIVAAAVPSILDFAIGSCITIGLLLFYKIPIGLPIIVLPFIILILFIFTIGLSLGFSILNVAFRDVSKMLPLFLQILLFASPVVYSLDTITDKWRTLILWNPLTGIIESTRSVLGAHAWPNWQVLGISAIGSITIFIISYALFKKGESVIADIV